MASVASAQTYPQFDISGFKKYEYFKLDVDPARNYLLAQTHIGAFYPTLGITGPWQERLQIKIVGKLSERLSVTYDIEQEPELPQRSDVKVTYDKHELTFGDFMATFGGNEFVTTTKSLNGVMFTSKDNWYDLTFVPSAKIRSDTQRLTSQKGNNTRGPYSLGHGGIVEGSERIELNGVPLVRNIDYTIDYFEGRITFTRILTPTDEFRYTYEYSSLMDIFFPTLSKRDFFGLRAAGTMDPALIGRFPKEELLSREATEAFPTLPKKKEIKRPVPEIKEIEVEVKLVTDEGLPAGEIQVRKKVVLRFHGEEGIRRARIVADRIEGLIFEDLKPEEVKVGQIAGEYVGLARGQDIFTVDENEAKINRRPAKELAEEWVSNLQAALREPRPKPEVVPEELIFEEVEVPTGEVSGRYQLKNLPVVPFSEKIIFRGIPLVKNEDYLINHNNGVITLLIEALPTAAEPMAVYYEYYQTTSEAEVFSGRDSRGPYRLAHRRIVFESEKVVLDGREQIRDLDYAINYQTGEIIFALKISAASSISVNYFYVLTRIPPLPPPSPHALSLGASYLRESAKAGAVSPTATRIEGKTGSEIINNNYTIYLEYLPITTEGLVLKVNDVEQVSGVDFVIPTTEVQADGTIRVIPDTKLHFICDKYDPSDGSATGTIKILRTLASTDAVSVIYTYKKSVIAKFTGYGNGSTGPYYITNAYAVVPGSERIQVWDQGSTLIETWTRNSSIEVKDGQYAINYNYPYTPYITFNDPMPVTKTFSVTYSYVPAGAISERGLSHSVLGFDTALKLGENFRIEGQFAKSETDQLYAVEHFVFGDGQATGPIYGDPNRRTYTLPKRNIMDGSEVIYINKQRVNRDIDYFINYTQGEITFYYLILSTEDKIEGEFDYQTISGIPAAVELTQGSAYKFSTTSKWGAVDLAGNLKKIDADFAPIGGLMLGLGSKYLDYSLGYKPGFLNFSYAQKETNTQLERGEERYLRRYDRTTALDFNPWALLETKLSYQQVDQIDDPEYGQTSQQDTLSRNYGVSLTPKTVKLGPFNFVNRNEFRKSESATDTVDKLAPSSTATNFIRTSNSLDVGPKVNFSLDYQVSEPYSTRPTIEGGITQEVSSTWNRSEDVAYGLSWDLTVKPFEKILARAKKITRDYKTRTWAPEKFTLIYTRSESYHLDLVPWSLLTMTADHNREETPSILVAGKGNPSTARTSGDVRYVPHSSTAVSWMGSQDEAFREGGLQGIKTSGKSAGLNLEHTLPVLLPPQVKLTFRYSTLNRNNLTSPSGTWESGTTITYSDTKDGNLSWIPFSYLTLSMGLAKEDYENRTLQDSTQSLFTNTQNITQKYSFTYKPLPELIIDGNYNRKLTEDLTKTLTPPARIKEVLSGRATYGVFTYGTLVYEWTEEKNRGEIQAGAVADLDIEKWINSLSLNITVPQNNPILTSVVFKTTAKWLVYADKKSATRANDFKAFLLTFEGTLNF